MSVPAGCQMEWRRQHGRCGQLRMQVNGAEQECLAWLRRKQTFSAGELPSSRRRGGCATKKMSRSVRSGADGVVSYEILRCEPPPRPLLKGGFAISSRCRVHLSSV